MPTKLIEQGRYDDALQLENMANEAIKGSEMPITVLCLYKAVPENLEDRFSEYHDFIIVLQLAYSKVRVNPNC
jgi:hypothetical protein